MIDNAPSIHPGTILHGSQWPEPVEIKLISHPLPHQIEAVYGYVLRLPRIRFLIADDPGAGKTIMAGLIIKEMKMRNQARRILIVAPGHLKDQWRRELKDRFEEHFRIGDRNTMNSLYGENLWARENQIITSIDFAKQDDILPSIAAAQFDLIIVDEAHKMSAYRYGEKIGKTERYKLGETLSRTTEHFLFLTARSREALEFALLCIFTNAFKG